MSTPTLVSLQVLIDWPGTGSFTDEAQYCRVFSSSRGRAAVTDQFGTGQATIVLKNETGRFSPYWTRGPLYPNVAVGHTVQVLSVHGGASYQFVGKISEISQNTHLAQAEVTLTLLDQFDQWRLLPPGQNASTPTLLGGGTIPQLIPLIVPSNAPPFAGYQLQAGQYTLNAYQITQQNALAELQNLAGQEPGGLLFIAKNGALMWQNGANRASEVSTITLLNVEGMQSGQRASDLVTDFAVSFATSIWEQQAVPFPVGAGPLNNTIIFPGTRTYSFPLNVQSPQLLLAGPLGRTPIPGTDFGVSSSAGTFTDAHSQVTVNAANISPFVTSPSGELSANLLLQITSTASANLAFWGIGGSAIWAQALLQVLLQQPAAVYSLPAGSGGSSWQQALVPFAVGNGPPSNPLILMGQHTYTFTVPSAPPESAISGPLSRTPIPGVDFGVSSQVGTFVDAHTAVVVQAAALSPNVTPPTAESSMTLQLIIQNNAATNLSFWGVGGSTTQANAPISALLPSATTAQGWQFATLPFAVNPNSSIGQQITPGSGTYNFLVFAAAPYTQIAGALTRLPVVGVDINFSQSASSFINQNSRVSITGASITPNVTAPNGSTYLLLSLSITLTGSGNVVAWGANGSQFNAQLLLQGFVPPTGPPASSAAFQQAVAKSFPWLPTSAQASVEAWANQRFQALSTPRARPQITVVGKTDALVTWLLQLELGQRLHITDNGGELSVGPTGATYRAQVPIVASVFTPGTPGLTVNAPWLSQIDGDFFVEQIQLSINTPVAGQPQVVANLTLFDSALGLG